MGLLLLANDAQWTHVLLLNNDATIASDYIARIDDALQAAPDAGLMSGVIYRMDPPNDVWFAGGRAVPWRALVTHVEQRFDDDRPVPTDFVTGCAMVVSREALNTLGPLPECYFPGYMEDAEYCWRARQAGLSVLIAPRAFAYHRVGASFGTDIASPRIGYLLTRHRLFFVRRNLRGLQRAGALAYMAITKPARVVAELLRARPRLAMAIARGTYEGFTSRAVRQ